MSSTATSVAATGRIMIVKVPAGEVPLKVREAWVGLILPCHPFSGPPDEGMDRGIVTGKEVARNRSSFSVPANEAIEILGEVDPVTAQWWRIHCFLDDISLFGFAEDEAEIVSGVEPKKIQEVTPEMMGDPCR